MIMMLEIVVRNDQKDKDDEDLVEGEDNKEEVAIEAKVGKLEKR